MGFIVFKLKSTQLIMIYVFLYGCKMLAFPRATLTIKRVTVTRKAEVGE